MNEFEVIRDPQMRGLNIFFDTVDYRRPHIHSEWEQSLALLEKFVEAGAR